MKTKILWEIERTKEGCWEQPRILRGGDDNVDYSDVRENLAMVVNWWATLQERGKKWCSMTCWVVIFTFNLVMGERGKESRKVGLSVSLCRRSAREREEMSCKFFWDFFLSPTFHLSRVLKKRKKKVMHVLLSRDRKSITQHVFRLEDLQIFFQILPFPGKKKTPKRPSWWKEHIRDAKRWWRTKGLWELLEPVLDHAPTMGVIVGLWYQTHWRQVLDCSY